MPGMSLVQALIARLATEASNIFHVSYVKHMEESPINTLETLRS
ncbi:hypothetical protein VPMS16_3691 [Vibrio sp. 16]|nr:hypothetical protein VPMS16_3691 [Vibrio sp. 16]